MKSSIPTLRPWLLALSAGTVISSTLIVQAVEYTWDTNANAGIQTGSANWATTATNWTTDGGATRVAWANTGTDSALIGNGTLATDVIISLNSSDIQLDDLSTGHTSRFVFLQQLSNTSLVRTLTLTGGTYNGTGTTGSQFNIATGGSLSFAGTTGTTRFQVTGSSDIVKLGGGNLFFSLGSNNNNFTGNIHIKEGSLFVNNTADDTSLGNSANDIYIDGGTLNSNGPVDSTLTLGSGRTIHLGSANGSIGSNNVNFTLEGQITGLGSLTKTGSKTLTLETASDYTGSTTINSGVLRLGAGGNIAGSSDLVINGAGNFNVRNTAGWTYSGTITGDDTGSINLNSGTNTTLAGDISGVVSINATTSGTNTAISGDISGATNLNVQANGVTLTLSGNNSYSGATTLAGGTLVIAAGGSTGADSTVTLNGTSSLVVNGTVNGALVATTSTSVTGTGSILGNADIRGTHNPGNSPGIQTFGNLAYTGGASTVNWELAENTVSNLANPNAVFDQIAVGGNLDFTDLTTLSLSFVATGSNVLWSDSLWDTDQSWTIYDVAGTTSNFANLSLNSISWLDSGGNAFDTVLPNGGFSLALSGDDVVLNYAAIPEPGSALLGGLGLLALLRRRRH